MSEVSAERAAGAQQAQGAERAAGAENAPASAANSAANSAADSAVGTPLNEKLLEIEAVLDSLGAMWDHGVREVPGWVGYELTFGQMRLLFLLSKNGPAPMSRVAEWLKVGLPAASGIVERVERHGLAMRRHRDDDRRVVECVLTDQGHRLIEEIAGMRRETLRQTLGVLTIEELAQLAQLISIVLERTTSALERQ
jgi:DNA-binding MarR family transcriptional regulator